MASKVIFEAKEGFKKITLEEMKDFISANYPNDKAWFKSIAFDTITKEDGTEEKKYNHLKAKKAFCKKYNPDLIPVAAAPKKPTAKELLEDWEIADNSRGGKPCYYFLLISIKIDL